MAYRNHDGTKATRHPVTTLVLSVLVLALASGCQREQAASDQAWAINVGGPAFVGVDGTEYLAEASVSGGRIGRLEKVLGSQDPFLYGAYREGDIEVVRPMQDGIYDVTFHFAEPAGKGPRERVFDVIIEGRLAIDDLDVMLARDGKVDSALTVTIPDVEISDGQLDISFEASAAEPVLSALVVRKKRHRDAAWQLAWSDEFDYEGIPDPGKWSIDVWPARKVNDEDQAYTARARNVRVADGVLVLEAHKETFGNAEYTSARVHSSGKGDFLYGRIEARAKLPSGKGTWPAIWMLPSDPFRYATICEAGDEWQGSPDCDAWPNSGEIDILEHVGYEMNHVHATVHNVAYYWKNWEQRKGRILVDGVAEGFHVYALEWTPERIDAFVDDTLYFTYVNENAGWEAWPYDHAFHLVLNVAVGGMWGRSGGGIDDNIFPQRMEVDYVRVYRRD